MLLNKQQAAEMLGIKPVTIDRLRKSGKLKYRQIGVQVRFLEKDITDFIEKSVVNEHDTPGEQSRRATGGG